MYKKAKEGSYLELERNSKSSMSMDVEMAVGTAAVVIEGGYRRPEASVHKTPIT
jgi:hypothetical protein